MSPFKRTNQLLYKSLNQLLKNDRLLQSIPIVIGDNIYIANYMIAKEQNDYSIFDVESKKCIGVCLSKDGAIAFARDAISCSGNKKKIKELDAELAKAENDVIFYNHSLTNTEDEKNKSSTLSRLEESKTIMEN